MEYGLDLNGRNAVGLMVSSHLCWVDIDTELGRVRDRRAPGKEECMKWTEQIVDLFFTLGLDYKMLKIMLKSISTGGSIIGSYFLKGKVPTDSDAKISQFVQMVIDDPGMAEKALIESAVVLSQAKLADSKSRDDDQGASASEESLRKDYSDRYIATYIVTKESFVPAPNVVFRDDGNGNETVQVGEQYTTTTISLANMTTEQGDEIRAYLHVLDAWTDNYVEFLATDPSNLQTHLNIIMGVESYLTMAGSHVFEAGHDVIISTVYNDGVLIGFTIGEIRGGVYETAIYLTSADATYGPRPYRFAVSYLEGQVIENLFENNRITRAKATVIIKQGEPYPVDSGSFRAEL